MSRLLFFLCFVLFICSVCARPQIQVTRDAELRTFGSVIKNGHITADEQIVFEHNATGCMTYFWMTGSWDGFGDTIVRYYVDGEAEASVEYPLFLGHGVGHDDDAILPFGTEYMGRLAHGSCYDTTRIPFGSSVKITVQLGPKSTGSPVFWVVVRGVENLPVVIGELELPSNARLHVFKNFSLTLQVLDFVTMLDVKGAGLVYQVTLDGDSKDYNYLEACVRAYIDGSSTPTFLSSGTEDLARSAFYFNAGPFTTPIAALTNFDGKGKMSFYTLFARDPILFQSSMRMTWRNMEDASCPTKWGGPTEPVDVLPLASKFGEGPVVVNTLVYAYLW